MKFRDYSIWVHNEIRESKIFTFLNIIGVWINVCILVIFFSLALGIEEAIVNQITKNIDLFTLKVTTSEGSTLSMNNFSEFQKDKRVLQISPVIGNYVSLKLNYDKLTPTSDIKNIAVEEDIYIENYSSSLKNDQDLRTNHLKLIIGKRLTGEALDGIIISETIFKRLMAKEKRLDRENILKHSFELVTKRGNNQTALFKCRVVGITEKTDIDGSFVYVTSTLAEKIDDWIHPNKNGISNSTNRGYNRFDLVTNNLKDLESLRKEISNKRYESSSILDRVDGIHRILFAANLIVFFIIGISILLSAFNIVITLTSYVLKRTREIGILKALGATDLQIQNIFLIHAGYLTSIGSILGAITGILIIQLIQLILYRSGKLQGISLFKIDFTYIFLIVLLSNLIGIISAVIPARKAAHITPAETMRSS
jgi:ABC-type lipoprotein release transport system permease subunit